jgi:hypothetical protein
MSSFSPFFFCPFLDYPPKGILNKNTTPAGCQGKSIGKVTIPAKVIDKISEK